MAVLVAIILERLLHQHQSAADVDDVDELRRFRQRRRGGSAGAIRAEGSDAGGRGEQRTPRERGLITGLPLVLAYPAILARAAPRGKAGAGSADAEQAGPFVVAATRSRPWCAASARRPAPRTAGRGSCGADARPRAPRRSPARSGGAITSRQQNISVPSGRAAPQRLRVSLTVMRRGRSPTSAFATACAASRRRASARRKSATRRGRNSAPPATRISPASSHAPPRARARGGSASARRRAARGAVREADRAGQGGQPGRHPGGVVRQQRHARRRVRRAAARSRSPARRAARCAG